MSTQLGGMSFTPFAARLAANGYSGRAAMSELRSLGFTFSDRSFWSSWRESVGYEKGSWQASQQPGDRVPTEAFFTRSSHYWGAEYTYRYTVRVYNAETGEITIEARNLSLDRKVTIDEGRSILQNMIEASDSKSGGVTEVLSFSGAFVFDPTLET